MRRTMLLSSLALVAGGLASSAFTYAAQKEARSEKVLPAAGVRTVRANVEVGSLRLRTDSASEVRVVALRRMKGGTDADQERWLRETKLEIDRQGDTVVIKDVVPDALKKQQGKDRASSNLELEVRIPRGLSVETAIGVGDLRVEGAYEALRLKSGVGDVEIAGDAGELMVHSGVGKLKLTEVAVNGAAAEINTGVGDIDASLRRIPGKDLKVASGVGHASVRIPAASKASVQLKSGVGTVKSDFPLTAQKRGPVNIGGSMRGEINGGGTALSVSSGTGNINLTRKGGDG